MRLHLLGIVSLFAAPLVACQPPDPAPEDLSELLRFTFSHYDTEDAAYDVSLADAAVNLLTWWETEAERAEDFDAALGYGASLIEEGAPMSEEALVARLDGLYEGLEPAAERDWDRWGSEYRGYSGWSSLRDDDWNDYQGEKAYLYDWARERAAWAREQEIPY